MERTRRTRPVVVASIALALLAMACRTSVAGEYTLDLDETKKAVDISAKENPEDAPLKDGTIKLLSATELDVTLGEDGKMSSRTRLSVPGSPSSDQKQQGTWKLENGRVVIKVEDELDTLCEVDGKRLRCAKERAYKLYGRYVLRRK